MGVAEHGEVEGKDEVEESGVSKRGKGLEAILVRREVLAKAEVPGKGKQVIH